MDWMKFVRLPAAFTSQPLCHLLRTGLIMIYFLYFLTISVLSLCGTILFVVGCFQPHSGNSISNVLIGILAMVLPIIFVLSITAMWQFGRSLQWCIMVRCLFSTGRPLQF